METYIMQLQCCEKEIAPSSCEKEIAQTCKSAITPNWLEMDYRSQGNNFLEFSQLFHYVICFINFPRNKKLSIFLSPILIHGTHFFGSELENCPMDFYQIYTTYYPLNSLHFLSFRLLLKLWLKILNRYFVKVHFY